MIKTHGTELTPADREQMRYDMTMFEKQAAQVIEVKKLERDAKLAEIKQRADAARENRESQERIKQTELDIARLEVSWLKLPLSIVRLPLYLVLGIAVCIGIIRKHDPPAELWRLLNK